MAHTVVGLGLALVEGPARLHGESTAAGNIERGMRLRYFGSLGRAATIEQTFAFQHERLREIGGIVRVERFHHLVNGIEPRFP